MDNSVEIVNNSNLRAFGPVDFYVMHGGVEKLLGEKGMLFAESGKFGVYAAKTLAIVEEKRYNIPSIVL